jgi:hypothetical protein
MKLSVLLSGAILPSIALAYPSKILQGDLSEEALAEISNLAGLIKKEAHIKRQLGLNVLKPGFNAKAQLISTSGEHKFVCLHQPRSKSFNSDGNMDRLRQARTTFADHAQV